MKRELIRICSSPKLFVYSLVWLMVLVTVGTVAQKDIGLYASQQKYFSSYFFFIGPLPLPGGRVVLALMLINLVSMMFKQNLWKMKKIGVIVVHLGGIMLLVGAGLTAVFSSEGSMVIEEGSKSNTIDSPLIICSILSSISPLFQSLCCLKRIFVISKESLVFIFC